MPIYMQARAVLTLSFGCLIGSHILQLPEACAAGRVANTTLAFPQEPYRYATVEAFAGLSFNGVVAMATPPGEINRLFLVEREGTIQVISNLADPTKTLFLNIGSRVNAGGEGGLLGLTFHPDYASNRLFYVFYTLNTSTAAGSGFHNRVARFETSPSNPNLALANSELPLITQYDESDNHNGGALHFGPDGYLYFSIGDEGGGDGSFDNSRFITKDFFGGICRIDVDFRPGSLPPNPHPASSANYAVPADNPFVGATSFLGSPINPATVRTEFWAVGFRNPWRFSFDSGTGRLYCGDVGEALREEVNVIIKGGHHGWNYREGTFAGPAAPPVGATFVPPILDYPHSGGTLGGSCVIGGYVYRGGRIPDIEGDYVFGDHLTGNIWALSYDGTNATQFRRLTGFANVATFGVDPSNGDILMSQPWNSGLLHRLVYQSDTSTPALPARLSDTGAFQNVATLTPRPGVVPYDINVPFWSDHAKKQRWFSVPSLSQFIGFNSNANWAFPTGTVWIKQFDLELTNGVPQSARRVETRFLIRNPSGTYGLSYRWNAAQTDALLVDEDGANDTFVVRDGGTIRTQVWNYPARSGCLACHTPAGGHALGFSTVQLNRERDEAGSVTNQLLWLSQMGYFQTPLSNANGLPAYAHPTNLSATIDHRLRSYLGANCVHCHQPGGGGLGRWDARLSTPLASAGIIGGTLFDTMGDAANRVIKPGSLDDSMIYSRISQLGPRHMPPLGTTELDKDAINLLAGWITNDLAGVQIISIESQPGAQVRIVYQGQAWRSYKVESSDNFTAWLVVGSSQPGADGQGGFTAPRSVSARFYRFSWP